MQYQPKIHFYDIPSLLPGDQSISPFANTVRYALQYKQLPYTSTQIELANIHSECIRLGIPPTAAKIDQSTGKEVPVYTLPAIVDSTDPNTAPLIVSDSARILEYLDRTYPDPERPLFPALASDNASPTSSPAVYLLADAFIWSTVVPTARPLIAEGLYEVITDGSKAHWKKGFFSEIGITEYPVKGSDSYNAQVVGMLKAFEGLADVLAQSGCGGSEGGKGWTMGPKPTFLDIRLRAILNIIVKVAPELWEKVRVLKGGVFEKFVSGWHSV